MSSIGAERESAGGDGLVGRVLRDIGTRPTPRKGAPVHAAAAYLNAEAPVALLVLSTSRTWRARIREACSSLRAQSTVCDTGADALARLHEHADTDSVPVIAIDLVVGPIQVAEALSAASRHGADVVLLCEHASLEVAGLALQRGALDLLHTSLTNAELLQRLAAATSRSRERARQNRRATRLKRICRRLCDAPRHVARQCEALWTDLMHTHRELGRHMNQVAISSEFGGLIRQELDLEVLLRTTLEYILSKSGPTNAAVFLPATSGDFTLGAYVNYDCPKETVDVLLDHMANVVAPRFEDVKDVAHLTDPKEIEDKVTGDAMWIGDSHIVAFACRHEGECLAIFLFFRDARSPYSDGFVNQLRVMRDLFAAQLARVVRIHHRHLPKEKWGALGDPPREENDEGMAM